MPSRLHHNYFLVTTPPPQVIPMPAPAVPVVVTPGVPGWLPSHPLIKEWSPYRCSLSHSTAVCPHAASDHGTSHCPSWLPMTAVTWVRPWNLLSLLCIEHQFHSLVALVFPPPPFINLVFWISPTWSYVDTETG